MERQVAASLILYLQKAYQIVPTTGAEWDAVSRGITILENVANGRVMMEQKPFETPVANGKDHEEDSQQLNN